MRVPHAFKPQSTRLKLWCYPAFAQALRRASRRGPGPGFLLSAAEFLLSNAGVDSVEITPQQPTWSRATGVPVVRDGEVHVWQVPVPEAPRADDLRLLSSDERQRAATFRFERDRARSSAARAALRRLIAVQLGMAPEGVRFETGTAGKPYLGPQTFVERAGIPGDLPLRQATELHFNVSHSHDVALIALAWGMEVGVDVEYRREGIETVDIAQRFFTAREAAEVRDAVGSERDRVFLACWTRKEACMKAIGAGLQLAPNSFEVGGEPGPTATPLTLQYEGAVHALTLHRVPPIAGYEAALAVVGPVSVPPRFWIL